MKLFSYCVLWKHGSCSHTRGDMKDRINFMAFVFNTWYLTHQEGSFSLFSFGWKIFNLRQGEAYCSTLFCKFCSFRKDVGYSFLYPWVMLELPTYLIAPFSQSALFTFPVIHGVLSSRTWSKAALGYTLMKLALLVICQSFWLSSFRRQWKSRLFISAFN